jgi:DNA repair protein RadA
MPAKKNGVGGSVIFMDTENTFRSERIFQIAEHRGISPDEILRRIYVCKIYNTSHLEMIIQNLGKSIEEYKAKLVLIVLLHFTEPSLLVGEHWQTGSSGSTSCFIN